MTFCSHEFVTPGPRLAPVLEQRGAYALISDDLGRLLLVRTAQGRHYLPGGRIEAGETPAEALRREIAEECGWGAEVTGQAGCDWQPIFGGAVRLEAGYWLARLTERLPTDPEHETLWLLPAAAAACLHREADRNAVAALRG